MTSIPRYLQRLTRRLQSRHLCILFLSCLLPLTAYAAKCDPTVQSCAPDSSSSSSSSSGGASSSGGGSCSANGSGSPCSGATSPASQSTAEVDTAAGNPINVVTGYKYQQKVDTVRYLDGSTTTQRNMTGTGLSFADIAVNESKFINYDSDRNMSNARLKSDKITGTVNMTYYLNWLKTHGYGLDTLTVQ